VALALYHSPFWVLGAVPVLALGAFLVLFFRNPARDIPREPGILVAPADGTVWDIEEVDEPEFVRARCVRIGIFLSIFDVHLNRAPVSGRVEWTRHREGKYHDARNEAARRENESNDIGIGVDEPGAPAGARLLVRQISGAIARRIVCPLEVPASVARGGLLGMIKYGSRTELYLSADGSSEVRVRVGEKVRAGASVVATWKSNESQSSRTS
jgi:phosphatidylserine decarboxylase